MSVAESGGDVSVFLQSDHTLILMRGDIDLSVVDDLEFAGRDAIDAGLPIVADVRHVSSMDSVGASFIVRLAASMADRGSITTMLGPSPRVRELLTTIGADAMLRWSDMAPSSAP